MIRFSCSAVYAVRPLEPSTPSNTCFFQLLSTRLEINTPAPQSDRIVNCCLLSTSDRTLKFVACEKDIKRGDSCSLPTRITSRDSTHSYLRATCPDRDFPSNVKSRGALGRPSFGQRLCLESLESQLCYFLKRDGRLG